MLRLLTGSKMRFCRLCTVFFAVFVLGVGAYGCGSLGSSKEGCSSTKKASCSGTFSCGNGGITMSCNRATQACVLKPGSVRCVTVPGASSSSCPSMKQAVSAAGCGASTQPVCSGSSGSGIKIKCNY